MKAPLKKAQEQTRVLPIGERMDSTIKFIQRLQSQDRGATGRVESRTGSLAASTGESREVARGSRHQCGAARQWTITCATDACGRPQRGVTEIESTSRGHAGRMRCPRCGGDSDQEGTNVVFSVCRFGLDSEWRSGLCSDTIRCDAHSDRCCRQCFERGGSQFLIPRRCFRRYGLRGTRVGEGFEPWSCNTVNSSSRVTRSSCT